MAGKWSSSSNNIRTLARALITSRAAELQRIQVDRVIPIPQMWHRRLQRHFNPAELVSREIGLHLGCPQDAHVLRRARHTPPQKRATLAERTAMQRDSFRIRDASVIRNQRLLLVDDVLTTGATCNEAVRTLLHAGAKECHVAVLARVAGVAN